jgi:S-adenosylmethionine-diacylglycerol 3-amino-3-carboxypropyl transferase
MGFSEIRSWASMPAPMSISEIQHRADFSAIRYAQCWEDSRLLTAALKPAGRHCLSIGSAGDNSFALLAAGAASVTAVEMNAAQVACIELRKAAYLNLDHGGFLELSGSRPSAGRAGLYQACRGGLPEETRVFWDSKPDAIAHGIGSAGKFERYFEMFRNRVLPLAHGRKRVLSLLEPRSPEERERFYNEVWNNRRWRWIFQIFFSRTVMGALGRDPQFFKYVEGSVADRILARTRHALVVLDPSENPYLHWILTGSHGATLPDALERDNFDSIREALLGGRLMVGRASLESHLARFPECRYDAFNLSDIFEYMSESNTADLLGRLVAAATPGARLAYWNMLAPRSRPEALAGCLKSCGQEAEALFTADRAFFYSRFAVFVLAARAGRGFDGFRGVEKPAGEIRGGGWCRK